jgi:hypothetical protein
MRFSKIDPDNLQALYDEWCQSGEPQRAFLQRKGLKFSVFNNHYGLFKSRKAQKEPAAAFLPVQLAQEPVPQNTPLPKLLLQFSGGVSLSFAPNVPAHYIGDLITSVDARPRC